MTDGQKPGAVAANSTFLGGVDRWIAGLGQLRDVVRQRVLAAQLAETLAERGHRTARILDLGCGQGTQALALARAGHQVTGLDISTDLLGRFAADLDAGSPDVRARVTLVHGYGEAAPELTPGPFDVLLCHGVLPYLDDLEPMLTALSQVAAPTAMLSVVVRNGLAPAMRAGLRGHWDEAIASFDTLNYVNRLGLAAHAHTPAGLDQTLDAHDWRPTAWYGVRVFTDHGDGPVPPGPQLQRLLAAELEAGGRDPYRQVAALLHLVYDRG